MLAVVPVGLGWLSTRWEWRCATGKRVGIAFGYFAWTVVVASIAVPGHALHPPYRCKSKQSEAKSGLKAIYTAQLAYNGEFGTYLGLHDLTSWDGLEPGSLDKRRYTFSILNVGAAHFLAVAADAREPLGKAHPDVWIIDEKGPEPRNRSDACR